MAANDTRHGEKSLFPMTTVWLLARRELLEYWRDGRLPWIGGIVLVLLLTALALGWQQAHRE